MTCELVAHWDGVLYTVERDPAIPLRDFMTELFTPTPASRVFATYRDGRKEAVLDTLLAGPRLLVADGTGLVVGDEGRVHLRRGDGSWRAVEGVKLMGPSVTSLTVVTRTSVFMACNGRKRTPLTVLDRASGALEPLPDLPKTRAIAILGDSICWVNEGSFRSNLARRERREEAEPTLVALPSSSKYLVTKDELLIAVLDDGGLAIVRGDDVEIRHPEHRFIQAWAPNGDAWYALTSGYAVLDHVEVERVGACLCRLRNGKVETIWAATPPPFDTHFQSGVCKSVAFGDDRIYLVHDGELVEIDPEGPIAPPVRITR